MEKALLAAMSASFSREEIERIFARSLLSMDESGIERLFAMLDPETASVLRGVLESQRLLPGITPWRSWMSLFLIQRSSDDAEGWMAVRFPGGYFRPVLETLHGPGGHVAVRARPVQQMHAMSALVGSPLHLARVMELQSAAFETQWIVSGPGSSSCSSSNLGSTCFASGGGGA